MRTFNVIVERDPDTGLFVGSIPGWLGGLLSGGRPSTSSSRTSGKSSRCSLRTGTQISSPSSLVSRPSGLRKRGLTVEELLQHG